MVTKCLSKALTKRPTVDSESDCCARIEKLNENCKHTEFGSFSNNYVQKHCSSNKVPTPAYSLF
ncbi:unnamed protein product [Eruca vesicaria subsp. sativa]|uniref:Prolamin-like domain-containing protein n=1 Tax=Eruca vesicaria subsp. sativa TaxID=29727 RepID=A0ABC8LD02_ERUVS|nr:unnamed protein product [Eruca vesicaria subsp. sativa]